MPKNHEFLIEIFAEVHKRCEKSVLLLVGDGALKTQIEQKVTESGLKNSVVFTGVRKDVPELLMAMDAFVFPSLYEGFPVALLEAQAAGLPCFASDSVTRESGVTDAVEYISLKQCAVCWAMHILSDKIVADRQNSCQVVKNAGYDVEDTAKELQEFYLERN